MDESPWVTLGQAVGRRRRDLRISARSAAAAAGINRATWATIESGQRRLTPHLRPAVEGALQWAPGSIDAILAGGVPTPLTQEPTTPSSRLAAEVERIRALPLPAEDRLAMIRALIDLWAETTGQDVPRDPGRRAG